ncbi:hypothetical protein OEZ72_26825, partial [Leclercia adecarboxylata]|nr:hypothetical protein [Leclercia adecarboxylata]
DVYRGQVAVSAQVSAKRFIPLLYWAVIVATTTAGTTMADFADRSLGIGYTGGSSILLLSLLAMLGLWYKVEGPVPYTHLTLPTLHPLSTSGTSLALTTNKPPLIDL